MKLSLVAGTTSKSVGLFIQDSTSTTGAGLTGLVFNSSGFTAYYYQPGVTASTVITLATLSTTTSAFSSGGFKEMDATNAPGHYRLDIPNAALTGATSVVVVLRGATNMAQLQLEIELTAWNNQDGVRGGMTALPNAAAGASNGLPLSVDSSGRVDVLKINGTSQTARDLGASVLLSTGTGTGQLDFTSGVVKANLAQILGTALTETAGQLAAAFKKFFNIGSPASTMDHLILIDTATVAGGVTGTVGSVTGSVGSVTAAVTVGTNNDKTGYGLSTLETLALHSGTAQAGAAGTITLASGASATDSLYVGQVVKIYGGTGAGQARTITAYVGSTKVATVGRNWATNPDNTSTYAVLSLSVPKVNDSLEVTASAVNGNVTGSVAIVGVVTGSVGSVTGAVGSVTARVTANSDQLAGQTVTAAAGVTFPTSVASPTNITAGTITTVTNLTNAPTSGDLTATMKTSVTTAATASTPTIAATQSYDNSGQTTAIPSNLKQILGTALTETSGLLAGGFKKFFNISSPTLTIGGTDQTGDSFARIGATGSGLTSLAPASGALSTTQWTNTRAANLDNLDAAVSSRSTYAGGAVASVTAAVNTNANATETAIKAKTDNLPSDPSSAGTIAGEFSTLQTHGDATWGSGGGITSQQVRDAMKLAPSGGSPAAGSIDAELDGVPTVGQIDTQLSGSHGSGAWGSSSGGSGPLTVTVTVTDGVNPLQNAQVQLFATPNTYLALTNSSGVATFGLTAATYSRTITKDGEDFAPDLIVVSAGGNFNAVMTPRVIPAPGLPNQCTCFLTTRDSHGAGQSGIVVSFTMTAADSIDSFSTVLVTATSAGGGALSISLEQGSVYWGQRGTGPRIPFRVPNAMTFQLPQILGNP